MATLKFDAIIENAKLISGFREIQNAVHQTSEKIQSEGKSIDDILDGISSKLNVAIGGWTASQFINQIMQVRGKFQQTEMAFKTMLQSEEKANTLMKELIHTAAITPFGVDDVTEGAKQLLAFNVAAEDVNKTLIGLGDVSAGMGIRLSDMVMLYGTTIAKGKMDTMDLYQFLNRGIPIADELAKVMGLDLNNAIAEVQKQIKAGKVTSDVFIQAMQNMTSQGSKFGGLMEAQSQTITGQISNIEDGIEQMFNELGRSQEGVINTGLDIVSKLVDNWESVGNVLLTVVTAYGAYKAVVITLYAIEKARIALNTAVRFIHLARSVTTAAQAMRVFNLACSANVLGLIVGAIAAAVAYFNIFGDKVESVAEQTEKFGEDAKKATSNVESLISILKVADKNSKVYKDTVKELSGIYSNYGIELTKIAEDESNIVAVKDEEIKKSQELVEQIKLESVERNRANAISKANETYNSSVDAAKSELDNRLSKYGNVSKGLSLGIQNIISQDVLDKLSKYEHILRSTVVGTKEHNEAMKEARKIIAPLETQAKVLASSLGLESDSYNDVAFALDDYLYTMRDSRYVYDVTINGINKAADANTNLSTTTYNAEQRQAQIRKQLQGTGDDVKTLATRIMNLMHAYGDNHLKFTIDFDAQIPKWMLNKSIPELSKLAKTFTALAKDLADRGKTGAKVNGKWESIDEIANKGYNYGRALDKKQDDADAEAKRRAKEKADAEANAKKNKDAAKKAKDAANKRKQVEEELNNELYDLQQKNIDETISIMQEGTEKKLAEIKNDYNKRKAEIDKQEAEFKKKNKEAGKKVALTSAQSNALNKARDLATQEYNKKIDEVNKEALTSMRDYLKEYGSLYQQKQAIAEEYEEKIAKAQTEGEKKTLQQEKKKALANFDYESISMGIDWKGLMSGVGNMSKEMLKPMLEKLDAYTNTDKFQQADTQTQQKVVDLMQEIRTYLGTDQNATWQNLAASISSFNQSVAEYQKAVEKENRQTEYFKSAKALHGKGSISDKELQQAKKATDDASQAVVDAKNKMNTFGIKLNSATEAVTNYTSGLTAALNKLGTWKGNEGFSEVQSSVGNIDALKGVLDESLSTMGDGVAKTMGATISKGLGSTLGTIGGGITNMMGSALGSIVGVVAQIPKLILNLASSIKSFVTGILDSFTQLLQFEWLSDLVDGILGAVGNLIDAIFDLPENLFKAIESIVVKGIGGLLDTVLGRVGNILSLGTLSSKGPSDWFTNSNAEKVQKTIDRLTDRNTLLQQSIEDLTDAMKDSYGSKATSYYEQAYKNQQEANKNYLDIAKAQASYHGAHGSWNHYWNGFSNDEMNWIRSNVKSDFNGDLFSLSPEEMKLLRGNVAIWEHIENTGKGNYGGRLTEKLNDYIDQAGKLEELSDQMKENLTQISFDSMKDSFISNLMDMSKSAQDFSDDFAEMMQKALLSYSMEDLINGDLKELYDDWAKTIKNKNGKLTDEDIESFNQRYDAIVQEGIKRRDEWSKVTGYDGTSSGQKTSSSAASSMTYEQADELNGRFTALQIAGENINNNVVQVVAYMQNIAELGISTNGAVLEIRNMMIMTNSYLEDMVSYAKLTYNDFGSKMDDICSKLKTL